MTKESWGNLNKEISKNLREHAPLQHHPQGTEHLDERLNRMYSCVQNAVESCVPAKKRLSTIKRNTSDATRSLYEARTKKFSAIMAQGGKVSPTLRKR